MTTCLRIAPPQKPKAVSATFPRRSARGSNDAEILHVNGEKYIRRESFFVNALDGYLRVFEHPLPLDAVTPLLPAATVLPAPHDSSLLVGTSVILVLGGVHGQALGTLDLATYKNLMECTYEPPPLDAPLMSVEDLEEEADHQEEEDDEEGADTHVEEGDSKDDNEDEAAASDDDEDGSVVSEGESFTTTSTICSIDDERVDDDV